MLAFCIPSILAFITLFLKYIYFSTLSFQVCALRGRYYVYLKCQSVFASQRALTRECSQQIFLEYLVCASHYPSIRLAVPGLTFKKLTPSTFIP